MAQHDMRAGALAGQTRRSPGRRGLGVRIPGSSLDRISGTLARLTLLRALASRRNESHSSIQATDLRQGTQEQDGGKKSNSYLLDVKKKNNRKNFFLFRGRRWEGLCKRGRPARGGDRGGEGTKTNTRYVRPRRWWLRRVSAEMGGHRHALLEAVKVGRRAPR